MTQRSWRADHSERFRKRIPLGGEARDEGVVQDRVLIADEGPGGLGDASELFAGPEPVGADRGRAQCHLLFQAGHADLEELIEIAAHDAQELEAFEQRHRLVARLLQDPAVELEQRQLAVEVEIGLAEVHHLLGRCRGGLGYLGRRGGARQGGARHGPMLARRRKPCVTVDAAAAMWQPQGRGRVVVRNPGSGEKTPDPQV